MLLSFSS